MSFETRAMDKLQRKRLCICILQAASRRNVAGNGVSPEQNLGFANWPFLGDGSHCESQRRILPPAQVLEHAFSGHRWMSTPVVSALGLGALL